MLRMGSQRLLAAAILLYLGHAVALGQGPASPPSSAQSGQSTWAPWTGERSVTAPPAMSVPGSPVIGSEAPGPSEWFDNLSLFGGLDGAKEPEDQGVNAHLGYRIAFNWGVPLWEEIGLGVQVGTAFHRNENAVRVLNVLGGPRERTQSFTSAGLFQRSDIGVNWGAVYDFRFDDYFGRVSFGQVRGQIGYVVTQSDEIGVWGTLRTSNDHVLVNGDPAELRPINQANLFWRHLWADQQVTRFWVGFAQSHGRYLLVAPGEGPVRLPITFGADLHVPLTDYLAIFGEAQFITPNDTGVVAAVLGVAFYPGGGARRAGTNAFAPLLPLGNTPSFGVDLRQ